MNKNGEVRAGILRVGSIILPLVYTDYFTGKKKLVNKDLQLRTVRRCNDHVIGMDDYYDFVFEGSDLPLVTKGHWPPFVTDEPVEGKKGHFKLVLDKYNNK